jgi:hypothetical protein
MRRLSDGARMCSRTEKMDEEAFAGTVLVRELSGDETWVRPRRGAHLSVSKYPAPFSE